MVSEKTNPKINSKKLSVPFILALVFCPMISAWFTLREGYSKEVRWAAFAWMFVSFIIVSIDNHKHNDNVLQEATSNDAKAKVEQVNESESISSKYSAAANNTLENSKESVRTLNSNVSGSGYLKESVRTLNSNVSGSGYPKESVRALNSNVDDSVYKPYDSVNNKLAIQQFGYRLGEIQRLRERFAERAVYEGVCESIQMSEVALDSNPNNPSFYIWCRQKGNKTVQLYADESQIEHGSLLQDGGLSESEAVTKCTRLIKDNTRDLSKVKVRSIADAVFQKYNDGTDSTKAIIGFSGKNQFNQKVSYRGFCEFDREGGVKSFSINP